MTDKEPTREQIKEFWEWCGVRLQKKKKLPVNMAYTGGEWENISLDLNNLFKYAMPKLITRYSPLLAANILRVWVDKIIVIDATQEFGLVNDPALALFWVIYEAINKEKATKV